MVLVKWTDAKERTAKQLCSLNKLYIIHCQCWWESILFTLLLQNYLTLLDDEDHTLESLKIHDEQQLVIEGIRHMLLPWINSLVMLLLNVISIDNWEKIGLIREMSLSSSTVRNKDMSWPEEMSFIANSSKMDRHKGKEESVGWGCTREINCVLFRTHKITNWETNSQLIKPSPLI